MSATERLRGLLDVSEGDETIIVYRDDVEVLVDLADVARARHSKQGCMTCDFDDPCAIAEAITRIDTERPDDFG